MKTAHPKALSEISSIVPVVAGDRLRSPSEPDLDAVDGPSA